VETGQEKYMMMSSRYTDFINEMIIKRGKKKIIKLSVLIIAFNIDF